MKKILSFISLSIILIGFVATFYQYISYQNGDRSLLFGVRDNYGKSETLQFDSLKVKVYGTLVQNYNPESIPKYPVANCEALSRKGSVLTSPYDSCVATRAENDSVETRAIADQEHARLNKELVVHFYLYNASDAPLNLSDYSFSVISTATLKKYDTPKTECVLPEKLLHGLEVQACIARDVDPDYHGPLVLVVTHNGQQKQIRLSI